uniref:Saposin B-type domain-containing protein n=1 Tax=Acrobeloides nanus TaxID=290746 RepID=A0A914DYS2_9BILA
MRFLILGFIIGLSGKSLAEPIQLDNTNCTICELLVDAIGLSLDNNTVDGCVELVVLIVCEALKIEDERVCKGIVSEFGSEAIYILKALIKEDPRNLCGFLPIGCGYKFDPKGFRWPLVMPGLKPQHEDVPSPPKNQTLKVLHLSDLHIDNHYLPGSEANCSEPQCCRSNNTNVEKAGVQIPAAYWGTIGNCDLPYWTAEDMLQQITKTHTDIDYVVVSGDLESHAVWTYNTTDHAYMIQNVSGLLRKYFPNTKVYFALGNHEGVPIDNIAPHWVPQGNLSYQLYNVMANAWDDWVPDDQLAVVKYRGCYMVKLYPGLRLISFNTLYGDPEN